jgi:hypothetical protein
MDQARADAHQPDRTVDERDRHPETDQSPATNTDDRGREAPEQATERTGSASRSTDRREQHQSDDQRDRRRPADDHGSERTTDHSGRANERQHGNADDTRGGQHSGDRGSTHRPGDHGDGQPADANTRRARSGSRQADAEPQRDAGTESGRAGDAAGGPEHGNTSDRAQEGTAERRPRGRDAHPDGPDRSTERVPPTEPAEWSETPPREHDDRSDRSEPATKADVAAVTQQLSDLTDAVERQNELLEKQHTALKRLLQDGE